MNSYTKSAIYGILTGISGAFVAINTVQNNYMGAMAAAIAVAAWLFASYRHLKQIEREEKTT